MLRYIKEKSDDVAQVAIPLFKVGRVPAASNSEVEEYEHVGLIRFLVNGDSN